MRSSRTPSGFILTIVAIMFSLAFVVLAVGMVFRTLTQLDGGEAIAGGAAAASAVDGCVEEALLQLRRDYGYVGGVATVGDAACSIAVSGSGGIRTIVATGTVGAVARTITVGVAWDPFRITSWSE